MIRISTNNPFAGPCYSPIRDSRFESFKAARKHVLEYVACVPAYFDETPCAASRIDGRTVPTVLAAGGTVRIERNGRPEAWMWDEDAVQALDEANGDA